MKDPYYPLVSVIVITYNSSKFVLETLESAKNQTYKNIELIVSDDSSTDNTVAICEDWIRENKGRFVRTEMVTAKVNTGIPANCNRGIQHAKGEWIRIVAGDDALFLDSIQRYIEFVNQRKDPTIEVLHSNKEIYNGTFSIENRAPIPSRANLKFNDPSITAEDQFQSLLRGNKVFAGTLFFKKKVFDRVGFYDEEARLWEDRPMLLKIARNGIKLHYVDFCSLKYRIHASSTQSKKESNKFLAENIILKNSYYYKNYLQFLPFFERFVTFILIQRVILFDKMNLNKDQFLIKVIFKLLGFPWIYISKQYTKKYL